MKLPEQPERSPAGPGVSRGRNYTSSWLGRLIGGGTIEDYAMFPAPPGPHEEAISDAHRVWEYIDAWRAEGLPDEELIAHHYGSVNNFAKALFLKYGDKKAWEQILMSVVSPRLCDYSVAHCRDDKNDPRLGKRIPFGISVDNGRFLDISLASPSDPHSLVFIGKEHLGLDFLRGIAYFANEIDTIPTGKKADRIALYFITDPSRHDLYREFTDFPTYHARKRKAHWDPPSTLIHGARKSLMDHLKVVQTSEYAPWSTDRYAVVLIPGLDVLMRRTPKLVQDTIVPLLTTRDPRIHVFATMGHTQEAIDLHLGKTPVFFDGGLYGATPAGLHIPKMRALDHVLHTLPPRQFALPDGKMYWVPRSRQT